MELSESSTLEFKQQVVDDIRKTVIAFANTNGGSILVGVTDDGSVIGVDNSDHEMLRITNMIRDSIKPDITMFVSCQREEMNAKAILRIDIQKGTECPYYLANKGIRPEGVFVRQGASSVPATENAIRRMIKETDGDSYEDVRSLNQELTFSSLQKEFDVREIPFNESQYKTLKLMNADGIYTNLGLLLSDQCPHTIKAAVFEGKDKGVFKDRREFSGSLLQQLNDAFAYISQYNRVRAEYAGLHRLEQRDYPEPVLREALLNSLVHRDYAFSASTLISIFDDRIEFVSIGGLVKGVSLSDMFLGISMTRNPHLAAVLYRLTLIEAYGTGVPKIVKSYEEDIRKPSFVMSDNAFKLSLPNRNSSSGPDTLTEQERIVVRLAEQQEAITRKDVEKALGVSQTMSGRILRQLVQSGILVSLGAGKSIRYRLKK